MEISKVTIEDGKHCAGIINALKAARFDGLTGKDLDTIVAAKAWLQKLAMQMAAELKQDKSPVVEQKKEASTMRVKSVGKLSTTKKKTK